MARSKSYLIPGLKIGVWIAALVPLGLLLEAYFSGALFFVDPIEEIQRKTGIAALILLLLSLSVTPLRQLTRWNKVVKFRRLLGVFSFFYALLHASSYFYFDQELSVANITADVKEHPWVLVGFSAFILLIPLAVTSTTGWIRRLGGKRWNKLHMLVYPIAILGVLHFYWLIKLDATEPYIYAAILAVLLGWRVYTVRKRDKRS
jgi:sulfoxide reductase heme-binding subunit YedZ